MRRSTPFLVAVLVVGATLATGVARAQACPTSVEVSPSPGWLGGPITVSGTGWAADVDIFANLDGMLLFETSADSSGAFEVSTTIPDSIATGSVLLFVQDDPADCEVQQQHEVLAQAPTTTTQPPATTSTAPPPATTTEPPTTTTEQPTTTVAEDSTTTTAPPGSTSTEVPQATTTTVVDDDGGGSSLLIGLLAALAAAALLAGGFLLARRRGSEED